MHCTDCGGVIPEGVARCPHCAPVAERLAGTIVGRPTDAPVVDDLLTRLRRELSQEYEVHGELGRGGMAVVYKATELELLRPVALKVLPPELSASVAMAERFRREARLAAAFDHPNIIPIYRVGQAGGVFFIAMKYIEGRSLDSIIEMQGPLPIPIVLHVLRSAVRALAFAHRQGVVHRDVKGANILVDQDARVVVADFGIARAGEDAGMTATGTLMGTPYFMSPEQCAGHQVGQQSDQYSLGVVAFQMLTGTVPFQAETIPGVMQHHFFTPPPDIRAFRDDVPPELFAIVQRALSKRRSDRYATTDEMQQAVDAVPFPEPMRKEGEAMLRDLVLGVPVKRVEAGVLPPLQATVLLTPPAGAPTVSKQRRTRRPFVIASAAGLLAVAAIGYAAAPRGAASAPAPSGATVADTAQLAVTTEATPDPIRAQEVVLQRADTPDSVPTARSSRATATGREERPAVKAQPTSTDGERAQPAPAAARLDPSNAGKLRVRVQPSDAEILVDGRVLARGVVLDSLLAAGRRTIRAQAAGYHPLDTVIVVQPGETSQIGTLRLLPLEQRP